MQIRQPRNLIEYLILALVLTAMFLAFMYVSDLKLTEAPEPEAAIPSSGPVVRSLPPSDRYEQRFQQLEQRLAQTSTQATGGTKSAPGNSYEDKLQQLELWLGQTQDAYEARFEQLEQRLEQAPAQASGSTGAPGKPYEAKLQQLEQRIDQAIAPHDERLQKIEQQLAQVIEQPNDHLRNIEERLAQTTARLNELSASLATLTDDPGTIVAANTTLRVTPPAALPDLPAASVATARPQTRVSRTAVPEAATHTAAKPEGPAPGTRTAPRQGKWVINIASYVNEKTAARNMGTFQKQGIPAEMVSANVSGRTIYRVRVAGFDTLEDAKTMAPTVERQLGLKETWIMAN